jgi:hypothetical protein
MDQLSNWVTFHSMMKNSSSVEKKRTILMNKSSCENSLFFCFWFCEAMTLRGKEEKQCEKN